MSTEKQPKLYPIKKRPNQKFFDLLGYTPFDIQAQIHRSRANIRVACLGRQLGKSESAAVEATFELFANPGHVGWVVAPTNDQANIIFARVAAKVERAAQNFPNVRVNKQLRKMTLEVAHYDRPVIGQSVKGLIPVAVSEFRGKSAQDPDNLIGATLNFVILDESAVMDHTIWLEKIQPMLSTTHGWALFISTPRGFNWFHQEFLKGWRGKKIAGKDPDDEYLNRFGDLGVHLPQVSEAELDPNNESFHSASWEARSDVGLDWYRQVRSQAPEIAFRQEYGAEFISHAGSVFGIGIDYIFRLPYDEGDDGRWLVAGPQSGAEYIIGADFGKSQDFSVFTVLNTETGRVDCMIRTNDSMWMNQKKILSELAKEYNDAVIIADSTGVGDTLVEDLMLMGLKVVPYQIKTTAAKEELIYNLSLLMNDSEVHVPDHPEVFKELRNFQYHQTPSGQITMRAYGRGHDDIVISLALAYSMHRGSFTVGAAEEDAYEGNPLVDALTEWAFESFDSEFQEANRMFS